LFAKTRNSPLSTLLALAKGIAGTYICLFLANATASRRVKKLTLGSAMALFPVIASLKKGAQLTIFDFFGLRPCKK
jgi:hypothetical protein